MTWSATRSLTKLPVAPANRPVPPVMFAVDLAHGTVSWKRQGSNVLLPLSAYDDILYGLQFSTAGHPRLTEVSAACLFYRHLAESYLA